MKRVKRILIIILTSFLGFIIGAAVCNGNLTVALIGLILGWILSIFWPIISPKGFRKQIKKERSKMGTQYINQYNHFSCFLSFTNS